MGGDINTWGSNTVRGNDVSDIFTAGTNGKLWHYNGITWRTFPELYNTTDRFLSVYVKDNLVITAGYRYINGIDVYGLITIGKR